MKTILVIVFALVCTLCIAQTSQLAVTPLFQGLEIDSVAKIKIRIQSTVRIHAYSISLSYDPTSMRCVFVGKADFFPLGGSFLFCTIDSINGRIGIDEALIGTGGRNGTGDLAEVRFKGIHGSTNAVQFVTANLRDTLNQAVGSTTTGGTIQVGQPNSVRDRNEAGNASSLILCYPNPFNSSTTVVYDDNVDSRISISIYDVVGQHVRTLSGNNHRIIWDGRDEAGLFANSGIYFVRLVDGRRTLVTKIQFIK